MDINDVGNKSQVWHDSKAMKAIKAETRPDLKSVQRAF